MAILFVLGSLAMLIGTACIPAVITWAVIKAEEMEDDE